ncbi:MAG: SMC family ATPase [Bacillota bacterium]
MKPIHLTMSAFASYGGVAEIPFSKFGSGIFLITGDTGAGKTTIFDGICFALFGEVSGSYRTIDSVRSDFALPTEKTFVTLTFEYRNETYTITRNPMYIRPKKNSDTAMTKQTADATLWHEGSEVPLKTGHNEVTKYVESLLGVDKKQFKQIAMIAQGEFLKLLYAPSTERVGIFRKIFRTDLYEYFQNELKKMVSDQSKTVEKTTQTMVEYLKEFQPDTDLKLLEHQAESIVAEAEKELAESEKILSLGEENREKILAEMTKQNAEIVQIEQKNQQIETRKKRELALENLQLELPKIEEEQLYLQRQRTALDYVQPVYTRFETARVGYEENKKLVESIAKQIDILTPLLVEKEKEKDVILQKKKEAEPDELRLKDLQNKVEGFQKKEQLETELREVQKQNETLSAEKKKIEVEIANQTELKLSLEKEKAELVELEKKELVLQQKEKMISEKLAKFKEVHERFKQYNGEMGNVQALRKTYADTEKIWQSKKAIADEMEVSFLRGQAGVLAMELVENEPCSVCGSTDHPKKAVISAEAPTEIVWKKAKEVENELRDRLNQLIAEGKSAKEKAEIFKKQMQENLEQLDSQEATLEADQIACNQEYQAVVAEQKALEARLVQGKALPEKEKMITDTIEKLRESQTKNDGDRTLSLEKLNTLKGQLQSVVDQIGVYGTKDELLLAIAKLEQYLARLTKEVEQAQSVFETTEKELHTEKVRLEESKKQAEQSKKTWQQLEQDCKEMLAEKGFSSVDAYLEIVPEQRELLEIAEAKVTRFFEELQGLTLVLSESEDVAGQEVVDLATLKETLDVLGQEKKTLELELDKRKSSVGVVKNYIGKIHDIMKKREIAIERLLPVEELSKTANGDLTGKVKIAFETYVQTFYFKQVLQEANRRFAEMTENRYVLRALDGGTDKRTQTGLDLEVLDQFTGKVRGIKTLSGGEAFKASLSLALGFSETIQNYAGGVAIDAMFIDEGFGALDDESRVQAIAVLQRLSHGNRLVGVISHITEMKEAIDQKIVAKKGLSGSTVKMEF